MVVVRVRAKRLELVDANGEKQVLCTLPKLRLLPSNWLEELRRKKGNNKDEYDRPVWELDPEVASFEQSSREVEPIRRRVVLQMFITKFMRWGREIYPSVTVKERVIPTTDEEYRRIKTRSKESNARRERISNARTTIRGATVEDDYYLYETELGWEVHYRSYEAIPRTLN